MEEKNIKETKVWNAVEKLSKEDLQEIKKRLEKDGIVIFPTDTVYGIGCNCLSESAIQRLYEVKKRKSTNPIGILTDSVEKIEKVAYISEKEKELIEKYMPGALTIILKKKELVPDCLTAGLDTIGVRIPDNEITLKILEQFPYPLAVTSANVSGEKEGIELEDIKEYFDGKIEGMIDGGPTKIQVASTIIKIENGELKVLREGTIKVKE